MAVVPRTALSDEHVTDEDGNLLVDVSGRPLALSELGIDDNGELVALNSRSASSCSINGAEQLSALRCAAVLRGIPSADDAPGHRLPRGYHAELLRTRDRRTRDRRTRDRRWLERGEVARENALARRCPVVLESSRLHPLDQAPRCRGVCPPRSRPGRRSGRSGLRRVVCKVPGRLRCGAGPRCWSGGLCGRSRRWTRIN